MQVQQDAPLYWLECANWRSYYTTNPLHKKKKYIIPQITQFRYLGFIL